ncbi:hypothetical protein [Serratia quinivorans]|uniref:hypothetical protein n=1 Tax=Serratia quinivorans TaxID=137545 RepID=UPI0021BD8C69|nr:hypothetical protein [Serratia quinivorans]
MMHSGRRRAKLTSLFTEPSQPHATAPDRNRTPQPPLAAVETDPVSAGGGRRALLRHKVFSAKALCLTAALVTLCGIVTGVVGMGLV